MAAPVAPAEVAKAAQTDEDLPVVSLAQLYRFATPKERLLALGGVLASVLGGFTMPALNLIFAEMLDKMSVNPATIVNEMHNTLVIMAILGPVAALCFFFAFYLLPLTGARVSNRVRVHLIDAVMRQDMKYFDEAPSGAILAAFTDDSEDMREGMSQKLSEGVQGLSALASCYVVSFYFDWRITLMGGAALPFFGFGLFILTKYGEKDGIFGKKAYEAAHSIVEETLSAMRTVMSFAGEVTAASRYEARLKESEESAIKQGRAAGLGLGFIWFGMWGMFAIMLWYGGDRIISSKRVALASAPLPSGFWTAPEWADEAALAKYSGFCEYQTGFLNTGDFQRYENTQNNPALDMCTCDLPWDYFKDAVKNGAYAGYSEMLNISASQAEDIRTPNCGCSHGSDATLSVKSRCVSGGTTVAIFFNILIGAMMAGGIGPAMAAIKKGRIAASRLYAVIDRVPDIDPGVRGKQPSAATGRVVLDKVHFQYPTAANKIFNELSLDIAPGETVALVGESGSGKSTVARLLSRFYDPQQGSVQIGCGDGEVINVAQLQLSWLREQIGLVSQEPLLFDTTISDNIAYGVSPAPSEEEIQHAAKTANAHEFISKFPDGYNTKVGARGSKLSGGQKQRVAIARALVRRPKILVLDEATSALDTESEKVVQAAIDNLMTTKVTCIVIAHRLSTIRNADRIVVLGNREGTSTAQGSCLVEQGSHDELMAKEDSLYKALVAAGGAEHGGAGGAHAALVDESESEAVTDALHPLPDAAAADVAVDVSGEEQEDQTGTEEAGEKKGKEDEVKIDEARLRMYTKPETTQVMVGCLAAFLSGCVWPFSGALLGMMITTYYSPDLDEVEHKVAYLAIGYGICAVLNFFTQSSSAYLFEVVGERMARRLRVAYFRSLLRQEIAWHEQPENSVGTLAARLSTDVKLVRQIAGQSTAAGCLSMSALIGGFAIAFAASWKFTLAFMSLFPLLAITEAMNWALMTGTENAVRKEMAGISGVFNEYVSGIREVQSFALEHVVHDFTVGTLDEKVMKLCRKQALSRGVSMFCVMFIQMNVYVIAFWAGGKLIDGGHVDYSSFNLVLWPMAMGASGMGVAASWVADAAKGKDAIARIFELFDRVPAIDTNPWLPSDPSDPAAAAPRPPATQAPEAVPAESFKGSVELRDVKFAYPTRQTARVFNGVNLHIPAGQTAALVGSSGCGKSTVIQLLERFYDPTQALVDSGDGTSAEGKTPASGGGSGDIELVAQSAQPPAYQLSDAGAGAVLIDGVDIRTLDVKWLRDNIGLVGQEPVLFNASVADNIAFGKPGATRDEIIAAAKAANAHDFISSLSAGYETNVGQRGAKVSGGQKQRIAIARALIKQPRILLLDEATSALDTESEKIVQKSLDQLIADKSVSRTTIMIAHRLSTIRNADCIYVLDNSGDGAVLAEKGTHDELIAKNGKYAKLHQAYSSEDP